MLKLKDIYKLNICTLVRKIKDNNLIGNLTLNKLTLSHNYNTRLRKNDNFYIQPSHTNLGKTSFHCTGPRLWQEVPSDIKNISPRGFKTKYKKFLINLYSSNVK